MTTRRRTRIFRSRIAGCVAIALGIVAAGCERASEWNSVFRRQQGWAYADGGTSARVAGGRTVWLFGDTMLHHDGGFLSNTIAVQDGQPGHAPAPSEIRFFARGPTRSPLDVSARTEDGMRPFVEPVAPHDTWLWPTDALGVDGSLVAFYSELGCIHGKMPQCRGYIGDMGFVGHTVLVVENPGDDPARWRTRATPLADRRGEAPSQHRLHWGSALIEDAGWLYVFGTELVGNQQARDVKLARVVPRDVGRYDRWQFLGPNGWQMIPTGPMPEELASVARGGAAELSVDRIERGGEIWFALVQVDVDRQDVVVRTSRASDPGAARFAGPEPAPGVRRFSIASLDPAAAGDRAWAGRAQHSQRGPGDPLLVSFFAARTASLRFVSIPLATLHDGW
jgi:hypothetical protein